MNLVNILNERVRIETPVATSDGQGGDDVSWETLTECFASVQRDGQFRPLTDRHRAVDRARYRITLYPNAAITNQMRVVWQQKNLPIHHTELYATHMVLVCEEEIGV
jgi:head-tail adaptor